MRVIIGYGNELRGEDAFGLNVINELEKYKLKGTHLISTFQLTPELVLELLDANEVIFIDACFSLENNYALACSIEEQNTQNLTHHISPQSIIAILNGVYEKNPKFYIYSMLTNEFEKIFDEVKYKSAVEKTATSIYNIS